MQHLRRNQTFAYFGTFVALGMGGAILGPTLPALAEQAGVDLGDISFLFTARSLGYLAGALLQGRLLERLPAHPAMAAALAILALALAAVPALPMLWLLALAMLVLGITEGVVDPGTNALLLWTYGDKAGPMANALHFTWGVGSFLAPVVVAQAIAWTGNVRWAYWFVTLFTIPVAAWLLRWPSPKRRLAGRAEAGRQADLRLVVLTTLFFLLYVGAEQGLGGWIAAYSLKLRLASVTTAPYLASAFWGSLTVGRLLAIPVAARVRPARLVVAALGGALASSLLLLVSGRSIAMLWTAAVGLGLSLAPVVPTTLALVERRMAVTAQATGWFFAGIGGGAMTVPLLIGRLFDRFGPSSMTWCIAACLVLAAVTFAFLLSQPARGARRSQSVGYGEGESGPARPVFP